MSTDIIAPTPPRSRARLTIYVAVTVLLALLLGLVGPRGAVQSAHAEDGNPTFRLGEDSGSAYVNFINSIRIVMNDGQSSIVPGAGNAYQVQHTNPNNPARFLQVDIHMYTGGFVRLQLDRRNLYLLGWWSHNNTYYYLGNRPNNTPDFGERSRMVTNSDGNPERLGAKEWQQVASENYSSLQTAAGENRADMAINYQTMNAGAMMLYSQNPNFNNQDRARGALRMTQLISEAARFRPIRDSIALAIGPYGTTFNMPAHYAGMENYWGSLSDRFNELLRHPQGYRDPHPLSAYRRDTLGRAVQIVLTTAILYAQYVLSTSQGRTPPPKRRNLQGILV
ncbi:ribosome-inactivating family protein [Streptomyces sp. NPDC006872]|uniref:ribosome-inactivating family protein n=1 Tax=Streptomyces sp. NPDC006872 TaxID=3155720 RepID=UPI0033E8E9B8